MRKNLIRIVAVALLLSLFMTLEINASTTSVTVNNKRIPVREVAVVLDGKVVNTSPISYINNGSTYVPVRFISEYFGANVNWIAETKVVNVVKDGKNINMRIDHPNVTVNGELKTIAHGAMPRLVNLGGKYSHTYVPLRFVSEALGLEVDYDSNRGLPIINNNSKSKLGDIKVNMDYKGDVAKINVIGDSKLEYEEKINGDWISYTFKNVNLKGDSSSNKNPFNNLIVEQIGSDVKIAYKLEDGYSNKTYNFNSKEFSVAPRLDFKGIVKDGEDIIIKKSPNLEYDRIDLVGPKRFVFDLYDVNLGQNTGERNYNITAKGISAVRAGQYRNSNYKYNENVVRVVLDCLNATKISVKETRDEIIITPEYIEPVVDNTPIKQNTTSIINSPNTSNIVDKNTVVNSNLDNKEYPEKMDKSKTIDQLLIGIDPGHGGKDPGAIANGVQEKDIVLPVALKVRDILKSRGYNNIYMIRETDIYVDFRNIGEIVNRQGVDVFVSIHANSAGTNTSAHGIETYSERGGVKSKKLAQMIQKELIESTGAFNRGAKEANFAVLKRSDMPSALVELGFVTNRQEVNKLIDNAYQDIQAKAIADGIENFIKSEW